MTLTFQPHQTVAKSTNTNSFDRNIQQISLNPDTAVIEFVQGNPTHLERETFTAQVQELTSLNKQQTSLVQACLNSSYQGTINVKDTVATLNFSDGQIFTRIWFDESKPGWWHSYSCPMKDALSSPQEAIASASEGFEMTVQRYLKNELYAFHYLDEDIQESIKAAAQRVLEQPIF